MIAFVLQTEISNAQEYWSLTGNSGTSQPTNFIGTTDAEDLLIKAGNCKMILWSDGAVSIGYNRCSTTYAYPYLRLSVDGTIVAKQIFVSLEAWPDIVFSKDYSLMPLEKISNYISENHSLPGIPKENEIKQNGINLGEMNAKLFQKIEELTLYIIEIDRKNKEQQKEIERIKLKLKNKRK
jgi:hypothetical protein